MKYIGPVILFLFGLFGILTSYWAATHLPMKNNPCAENFTIGLILAFLGLVAIFDAKNREHNENC